MLMALVGSLIVAGIILSFYGSQKATEGLISVEFTLEPNEKIEILAELDPNTNSLGVFVIQGPEFEEKNVFAQIVDPSGIQIVSSTIENNSVEERFEITATGNYKLIIENNNQNNVQGIGVIGHMPNTNVLSLGYTGFYLIIVGMVGIVGMGIYTIKNRKKSKFS